MFYIEMYVSYENVYGLRVNPCAFIMHRRPIEIIIDIEN